MVADGLVWCGAGTELVKLVGISLIRLDTFRMGLLFRLLSGIALVELGSAEAAQDIERIAEAVALLERFMKH